MKYKLTLTSAFKKDLKRISRQPKNLVELKTIVELIASDQPLEQKYHDHQLTGNLKDFRECHIRPDWLLIYQKIQDKLILVLSRTGSHSDLLKK